MALQYYNGVYVWVLYSEQTGEILKVVTEEPINKSVPKGYKWDTFITTEKNLKKIYKFRVTRSGLEKGLNKFLTCR